jgi:hypothetical protein
MSRLGPFAHVIDRARAWPVESQQVARRNAMVACTALAARRAEREDVEEYLAGVSAASPAAPQRVAARG